VALQVIGAGLGRTGTLSLKLALEQLGMAPCHHMIEVLADVRRMGPLWEAAAHGRADWDQIFSGFSATTDHPACRYWRELAEHYPRAKIILTVRDADSWFDSISRTIMSPPHVAFFDQTAIGKVLNETVYSMFDHRLDDRAYMTERFRSWNQSVMDEAPAGRLLVFDPRQGWEPLCHFLELPVPDTPYPHANSSAEMQQGLEFGEPPSAEGLEEMARGYLAAMRGARPAEAA
jgi:hypothetical protein